MLVEIHAGTIDSNLNEMHQSWLSLIVGEQLFGRGELDPSREPVAKRFFRRLYDENFHIFHKAEYQVFTIAQNVRRIWIHSLRWWY